MRKILSLTAVLIFVGSIALGYFNWPSIQYHWEKWTFNKDKEEDQQREIDKAKQLFSQNKLDESLEIIKQHSDNINDKTETGKQWLELLILVSETLPDVPELVQLYDHYPNEFDRHEKASLLVANALVSSGRTRDYQEIRSHWTGREAKPETWFVLDTDKLLQEGKRKEAQDLLKSRTFSGPTDIPRLVRLALLNALDNPKEAWDYLAQAYTKDPQNAEILSYRAKLLETYGQNSEALVEYLAALQTDPNNPFLKDQLAEYYLRHKQYADAMALWKDSLQSPPLDHIWIKTLFWNRMIIPIQFDWDKAKHPDGKLTPYLNYLLALKPGQFWNAAEFEKIPNSEKYLVSQQSAFWLRLLQYLRDENEKEAYMLLQYNPFGYSSWNPALENTLKRILLYRKTGQFTEQSNQAVAEDYKTDAGQSITVPKDTPTLFTQLEYFSKNPPNSYNPVPDSLNLLLKGPEAFSAALIAAGWDEAGLALHTLSNIPKNYPEWVSFNVAQALSRNRSPEEALKFALKQYPTTPLSMFIGEAYIAEKKYNEAAGYLTKIYKDPNNIGKRSAWLLSLIYIDQGDLKQAEEIVHSQPLLENDVTGKETLARIALLEKKMNEANDIYESIANESPEAKSYLARKAYKEGNLHRAKQLTEQLLREFPTNTMIQENYRKISEELKQTSED